MADRLQELTGRILFGLLGLAFLGALLYWIQNPVPPEEAGALVVQSQLSAQNLSITVANLGQRSVYLIGGCGKFGSFTGMQTPSYGACGSEAIEVQPSASLSSKWVLESTTPVPGETAQACVQYAYTRWSIKRQELCAPVRPS